MKWIIVAAACLAACAAVPVKEDKAVVPVSKPGNETVSLNKTEPAAHSRVRRDCGTDDLGKLQAKLTYFVEQEFEKMFKVGALPEANRTRRAATSAAAGSVATPDGKVKSTAVTKGNSDGLAENGTVPVPEGPTGEPKNAPVLDGTAGAPGHDDALPPPQEQVPPPAQGQALPPQGHLPDAAPLPDPGKPGQPAPVATPILPAPGAGLTFQKVKAVASKENGTAVSSAVAKRAVHQDIAAEGDKAISKAESHKGGDSHLQNVGAEGGHLGIATANIDGQNLTHNGSETTLQNVKASGDKAVATAAKKTDGGNAIQSALAEGGQLSIASVSSGSEAPNSEPSKIVKRSVCLPEEMNDNIRLLIRTTIENAFASFKQDMHH